MCAYRKLLPARRAVKKRKNYPTAVEAVKILRDRGRQVELLIAGTAARAEYRSSLETLVRDLNLTDIITRSD